MNKKDKYTESDILAINKPKIKLKQYENSIDKFDIKLETFEDLLKRDEQREKDGFPRKIKVGRLIRPGGGGGKDSVVIVPTTVEEKLVHGEFNPNEETGGQGDGEEGDVVDEEPIDQEDGGSGQGAGQGSGGEHGIDKEMYETGRILTEEFELPNLQEKRKKVAIPHFTYDLTDKLRKTGQVLDKKDTLRNIIKTNLAIGNIKSNEKINSRKLIVGPDDKVFRVLSPEKQYESQAIVFFVRDYSGSMGGDPTDVVVRTHLMIYSWLVYQYENRVIPKFILHDTDAYEVDNFNEYYNSKTAGGTVIDSAYQLVDKIVSEENLDKDYNLYMFQGTDGDDWRENSDDAVLRLEDMLKYMNRVGITMAVNKYTRGTPLFEEKLKENGLLPDSKLANDVFKFDKMRADSGNDNRIIEGLKKLIK